jgi:5-methylcytosine-specific restriction protein A
MAKIMRLCRKAGCKKYAETPAPYCPDHMHLTQTKRPPSRRSTGDYNNQHWRKVREYKLNLSPLCERCQEQGRITSAAAVHHIDHNSTNNNIDNLQSLCRECHEIIHKRARENIIDFDNETEAGEGGLKVPKTLENTAAKGFWAHVQNGGF